MSSQLTTSRADRASPEVRSPGGGIRVLVMCADIGEGHVTVARSLADSLAELWAARLMTYEAAAMHDRDDAVALLHAHCSLAKLTASEMANRVADRIV